jgi:tRNA dimethylallyltransferase
MVDPNSYTTAGEYAREARRLVIEIASRGTLPIVVGGTGLYLRALLDGLFAGPGRSEQLRERLRAAVERRGSGHLHKILRRLDPEAAEAIHSNDAPKLIRAIEVCLLSRRPITEQWQQGRTPLRGFRTLRIGLHPSRAELYDRLNRRVAAMFEAGLIQETKELLEKHGEGARPFSSIGYREAVEFLQGKLSKGEAVAAVQQAHRNYAKRQMTWFRREPDVRWIAGFGDDPQTQASAIELVRANLHNSSGHVTSG